MAASGEAKPISRFFDTLEYRERDPERVPVPKYGRRMSRKRGIRGPGRRRPQGGYETQESQDFGSTGETRFRSPNRQRENP
jgi:hypothetical protein